ncbi:hypothetical protein Tco_0549087 [Tanacetum coccineum]
MKAVLEIIRYLKGTPGHGVLFKQNGHLETQLYTDADWAGDKGDRRSTSGYLTLVGVNIVTWRSKKQKVMALSSAEAEFRGIARGITEVLWIRKLLTEIGYPPQEPSKVMKKLEAKIITLPFVRSEDQLADVLTKAVNERSLHECLGKLNFGNPTIQLKEEC